jgi:hypothetical protein
MIKISEYPFLLSLALSNPRTSNSSVRTQCSPTDVVLTRGNTLHTVARTIFPVFQHLYTILVNIVVHISVEISAIKEIQLLFTSLDPKLYDAPPRLLAHPP